MKKIITINKNEIISEIVKIFSWSLISLNWYKDLYIKKQINRESRIETRNNFCLNTFNKSICIL